MLPPRTETTAYYARVLKADVPLALDVLSDILANPSFDAEELEREKSVIEQEIGAAQDTPDDVDVRALERIGYPDQPMGRSTARNAADAGRVQPRQCTALPDHALSRT